MRILAVDWSGARDDRGATWVAEVVDERIRRLERSSRGSLERELLSQVPRDPEFVLGLDFAFSFPAWFLRERHLRRAPELWDLVAREGEAWLAACDPPFWGRPGKKLPALPQHFRLTDRGAVRVGSSRAKSVFQIGGRGAVGTGSLRGMPFLLRLRQASFQIWPFEKGWPRVVEIYPRALTGPVVKTSAEARAKYLAERFPEVDESIVRRAAENDSAFDAAVSALVMWRHADELRSLPASDDGQVQLEGWIWQPGTAAEMPGARPSGDGAATAPGRKVASNAERSAARRADSTATAPASARRGDSEGVARAARRETEPHAAGRRDEKPLRDLKIAVLGAGRIGETLIAGLLEADVIRAENVTVTAGHQARVDELRERFGVGGTLSNARAAEAADVVVLSVKPRTVPAVLEEIGGLMEARQLLVSVAAAVSTRFIEERLGPDVPVVRAMPNTPCLLKRGMTGLSAGRHATAEHLDLATFLFEAVGRTVIVDEKHMDAVTGLSASGPAYVYVMIESLAEGGVKVGLPREIATQLAAQTVLGAASMVLETGEHPAKLKDTVTTPAGCTIDGLLELEEGGLRVTLIKTVVTATRRAGELLDA